LEVDVPNRRISLGMKQAESNPWDLVAAKYPKGMRITGKVKNVTDFGVFVGVEEGIDGLVHVSDLSWSKKTKNPLELFKKGQVVEAVVLNIDRENERFSLGIKQLEKDPWFDVEQRYRLGMTVSGAVTNVTDFTLASILILFTMYYLFKEGDAAVEQVKALLPLSKKDKDAVFKKSRDVIYATLYGGVLVSVLQGLGGGLIFWILGIASPIFWGSAMALLAFLPVVGTPLVWIPAAIYLFLKVSYIKAAILVIVSVFLLVFIDTFLKPMIVSGRTEIHPLLLLFSILGGMKVMGFIGIIAGPIILSLALTIIEIYKAGYLDKTV